MEEIKKFLRMMDKEEIISLCASLLFQTLVSLTTLATDIAKLESRQN